MHSSVDGCVEIVLRSLILLEEMRGQLCVLRFVTQFCGSAARNEFGVMGSGARTARSSGGEKLELAVAAVLFSTW